MRKNNYDEIRIENLEFFANHGVYPEETRLGQKFMISLTMYTDTRRAGRTMSWSHLPIMGRSVIYCGLYGVSITCKS